MAIHSSSTHGAAQRLSTLAQLYQQGQASALMERALDKLLTHEAEVCRAQLQQLQGDLSQFEKQYGLSAEEFYRRFQAGQTDDRMDFVEWASLVQMADNLKERLRLLAGEATA
ncbi:MAG: hypothetical protein AAB263_18220 [Planctomycetota bacterium]